VVTGVAGAVVVAGGLAARGLAVVLGTWAGARVVAVVDGVVARVVAVVVGPEDEVVGTGSGAETDDRVVSELVEDVVVGARPVAN
jgi:hypothetical protein